MSIIKCTPLTTAIMKDDCKLFKELLLSGKNVNLQDNLGNTPLHIAVLYDRLEIVQLIIEQPDLLINAQCFDGQTSLYCSILRGNLTVINILINADADINITTNYGETPLHPACATKFPHTIDIVKVLVEKGTNLTVKDGSGYTVLHVAVDNDNVDVVRLLLAYGADPNITESNGLNVLMLCFQGHLESAEYILPFIKDVNAKAIDGWTTIMLALNCINIDSNLVKNLLNRGANINVQVDCISPLYLVVNFNDVDLYKQIYDRSDLRLCFGANTNFFHVMISNQWYSKFKDEFEEVLNNPILLSIIANTPDKSSYITALFVEYEELDKRIYDLANKLCSMGATISVESFRYFVRCSCVDEYIQHLFMDLIISGFPANLNEWDLIKVVTMEDPESIELLLKYCLKIGPIEMFHYLFQIDENVILLPDVFKLLQTLLKFCTPLKHEIIQCIEHLETLLVLRNIAFESDEMNLITADGFPSLKEISRDAVRKNLRMNCPTMASYKTTLQRWELSSDIKEIIQCTRAVNNYDYFTLS